MSESPLASNPGTRNRAAQASLVIALIFLIQCVAFLVIIIFYMSSWGIRFVTTNPTHPLASLGEIVVELSILFVPIDLITGALAILLGVRGRRAARRLPDHFGESRSLLGIVLGMLVLLLPFVTVLVWASGFKQ